MWSEPEDFTAAEIAAEALLKRFGIVDPTQIELEDVAYALGVTVLKGRLDGAEAWLLRRGERGVIRARNGTCQQL